MYMPKKENPFYYGLKVLQFTHFYPLIKINNPKFYNVVTFLFRAAMVMFWVECLLHKIMSVKNNSPVDTSEDLAGFVTFVNYMYICCTFRNIAERYSNLFIQITDTEYGVPPKMKLMVKIAKLGTLTVLFYALISTFTYALVKYFIESKRCKEFNVKFGLHELCALTPFWWPFENTKTPWYYVIMFIQLLSAEISTNPTAMVITMSWEAALIIKSKIHHLKDLFTQIFDSEDPDLRKRRLRYCIQYHQQILSMATELNEVNQKVVGQMSFAAAIIMSTLATQLLQVYSIAAALHLIGYAVIIFFICETGQEMQDETYNIQDAINESNWYKDPKLVKDLQLVLLRCQKPIYMKSVLLGAFNYSQLIMIGKTAYSYFTLLTST